MSEASQPSVEIAIDRERCRFSMYDPRGCKRCLQICPTAVFASRPIEKRDFSKPVEQRVDPTVWTLLVTWEDYCNGCGACIRACPHGALSIKFDGSPVAV